MKKTSLKIKQSFGFTLIELLVVIAILGLLAGLTIPAIGKALNAAKTTQAISGIRQSGIFLLAEATQNQGKLGLHIFGSSSGMEDFRLEGIVSRAMGIANKADVQLSKVIRTPAWYKPPFGTLTTWHVWGVGFENLPEIGVFWDPETVAGYPEKVHFLRMDMVTSPTAFVLLGDSSDINGAPHLRLSRSNAGGISFAMRYDKRGPIFTMDGSARMIGQKEMETYSLRRGYLFKPGNPATKPTLIKGY